MLTFYQFIYLQFNILAIVHNLKKKISLLSRHVYIILFVCYFSVHYLVFFQLHLCEIKLYSKICYRYNL